MNHRVLFEIAGQTLRHVAPEFVSSATYSIEDLTKAQSDATRVLSPVPGNAIVPAWTLTLDDPAGASLADSTLIPVTATAGPGIGDVAVVIAADGAFEAFELEAVALNNYLRARSMLAGEYVAADTVRGVTMTAPVPPSLSGLGGTDSEHAAAAAALEDQRPLRVVWEYTTAAGVTRVSESIALTRGSEAVASVGGALEVVRLGYPDISGRLLEGLTLEALGAYSLRQIRAEFAARQIDHAQLLLERGDMLLVAKILAEAAFRGYAPGQIDVDKFAADTAKDYERQIEAIVVGQAGRVAAMDYDDVSTYRLDPTYRGPLLAR